jgi:hypothetical protein
MNGVLRLPTLNEASATERGPSLSTAHVVSASAVELTVRLVGGGVRAARLATTFGYEPAPGDEVVVISDPEQAFVIGVLRTSGKAVLSFPGDVDLRAVGGRLRLAADEGLVLESPTIELRARKLAMLAGTVMQRFDALTQKVRDLLAVRAGQTYTVVEGSAVSQSKSARILTKDEVTINGKEIHLG